MKVALVTPWYLSPTRGNAVTVRRIARFLSAAGCDLLVLSLDADDPASVLRRIRAFGPDIIHCFHAVSTGPVGAAAAAAAGVPLVVTFTGTDAYQAIEEGGAGTVAGAVGSAAAVTVFHESVRQRLLPFLRSVAERIIVVPQGVEVPPDDAEGARGGGGPVFFLPAGLRRVKDVTFALAPLARLAGRFPSLRLLVAGPPLDEEYAASTVSAINGCAFARYAGAVDHDAMGDLYRGSDVVLNTSLSEGGMANSVLEAFSYGKPVLASDIDGNRSLVTEGITGMLYACEQEFEAKAALLAGNPGLRAALGLNGRRLVREWHSPLQEAARYIEVYRRVA